jgi:hypothetical protein
MKLPQPNQSIRQQVDPRVLDPLIKDVALRYTLYEKAEDTELTQAFIALIEERHKNFHTSPGPQDWRECGNQVCAEARQILERRKRREIFLTPLAWELMNRYMVGWMQTPQHVIVKLMERNEAQLPDTAGEKQQASRIVLASS